jgi:signal transduction histidine kinase
MEDIIAGLLDGVEIQTGRLRLRHEDIDLAELCANVVRDWAEREPEHGHVLHFEGDTKCRVLGDRKRLERVLINLLSNAIKYSPAGQEVEVSVWRRGTRVRLAVTDQGEGISSEDIERVFEPFTRLDRTRHMASGTGMGLVSVKKIIEAHGGTVRLESEPEQGTTVEVWLKAMEPNAGITVQELKGIRGN